MFFFLFFVHHKLVANFAAATTQATAFSVIIKNSIQQFQQYL